MSIVLKRLTSRAESAVATAGGVGKTGPGAGGAGAAGAGAAGAVAAGAVAAGAGAVDICAVGAFPVDSCAVDAGTAGPGKARDVEEEDNICVSFDGI